MSEHEDLLPVTVLLPATVADAIVIYDSHAALRFALVERLHIGRLGPEWDQPGNYLLLDPVAADGKWGCYVGKASPGGLRTRLMEHLRKKEDWRRAILIQRDTTHAFNSAQVAWLEGRLHDLLENAEEAVLSNKNRPKDETLPAYERAMLEACVVPVSRLLRLLGYDAATADDAPTVLAARSRTNKFLGVNLTELLAANLLTPGMTLTSTNSVWPATATVTATGMEYEGIEYTSPSAAAHAVKDGPANGWDFWAIDTPTGKVSLATLRARYQELNPPT